MVGAVDDPPVLAPVVVFVEEELDGLPSESPLTSAEVSDARGPELPEPLPDAVVVELALLLDAPPAFWDAAELKRGCLFKTNEIDMALISAVCATTRTSHAPCPAAT